MIEETAKIDDVVDFNRSFHAKISRRETRCKAQTRTFVLHARDDCQIVCQRCVSWTLKVRALTTPFTETNVFLTTLRVFSHLLRCRSPPKIEVYLQEPRPTRLLIDRMSTASYCPYRFRCVLRPVRRCSPRHTRRPTTRCPGQTRFLPGGRAIMTLWTAMARLDSDQLPGEEVRPEQTYHHHRSEEAMPQSDHAACGYLEGG